MYKIVLDGVNGVFLPGQGELKQPLIVLLGEGVVLQNPISPEDTVRLIPAPAQTTQA